MTQRLRARRRTPIHVIKLRAQRDAFAQDVSGGIGDPMDSAERIQRSAASSSPAARHVHHSNDLEGCEKHIGTTCRTSESNAVNFLHSLAHNIKRSSPHQRRR